MCWMWGALPLFCLASAQHHHPCTHTLTDKQQAGSSMTPVVLAPTLGISGLQDGCIAPQLWDLTMGGDGERCVR